MIKEIDHNCGGKTSAHRAADTNNEDDFKKIVDLLADHSTAENELAQLEAAANEQFMLTVDGVKSQYARLQRKMIEAGTALELLARKHPEWFADKKTIKTPYGSVQLKTNPPKIVAENPELSIVLIEAEGTRNPEFDVKKYVREEKTLNLEGLAALTDGELKKFRIHRDQSDTFTVKSAKLDMGKAVKEAVNKEAK
jgi:hypothetical protein